GLWVAPSLAASASIARDRAPRCYISATAAFESARERGRACGRGALACLILFADSAGAGGEAAAGVCHRVSRVWADWQRSVLTHRVAQRVLCAADRVLHFAGDFLRLAFAFGLGIARDFAEGFLDLAFGLAGRAFDTILVHDSLTFVRSAT